MAATVVAVVSAGAVWYTSQSVDRGQPGQACITDQELLGNVAAGFWIAQRIQAERCDRYFNAVSSGEQTGQADTHTAILAKFQSGIEALKSWETASFTRRYGEMAETVHRRGLAATEERYKADIRADALTCRQFDDELAIRLESDWPYIQAKLRHGMTVARRQPGMGPCGN